MNARQAGAPDGASGMTSNHGDEPRDPAQFWPVALLLGGTSAEREVSLNPAPRACRAAAPAASTRRPSMASPALFEAVAPAVSTACSTSCTGRGGEDGVMQGALDALGVPYTGSGVLGSALTMDKIRSKQVWIALGLPTPRFGGTAGRRRARGDRGLGLPVVVKPATRAPASASPRVQRGRPAGGDRPRRALRRQLLIEQLIIGDEYTVGILGRRGAAVDPHRAAGRVLRLSRQVRQRRHAVHLPGPAGDAEAKIRAARARGLRAAGLQRLGPGRHHARP